MNRAEEEQVLILVTVTK